MKKTTSATLLVLLLLSACQPVQNKTPEGDSVAPVEPTAAAVYAVVRQSTDTSNWPPSTRENVNSLQGVTMTIKEGSVSATGLTVVFENTSSTAFLYGEPYSLEAKIDDAWYVVPTILGRIRAFNAIGYGLLPNARRELTISWGIFLGILNPGEYRLLKDVTHSRAPGDYDEYVLAVEFSITD